MNTRPTEERVVDFSGRTLGPYRLQRLIGTGGSSTVYRGEDTHGGAVVAIKVLDPRSDHPAVDRFRREIALTRVLYQHDGNRHVIRVFDNGVEDGLRWYAMELLDGHNLRDVLNAADDGGLRWEVAAFILQNVCYAVSRMHEREVVHRDLKPDNIILERTPTGQIWIKIIDLGIAKEISIEAKTSEGKYQTSRNEIPGTGPYIAPERFSQGLSTAATDQYSLGVVLYECLHGKFPFPATDNITTLAVQAHGSREEMYWNPLPRALRDIVLRAMSIDSGSRYSSVHEMGQALHLCLKGAGEYVDGQAATLRLLDRLSERRGSSSRLRTLAPEASVDAVFCQATDDASPPSVTQTAQGLTVRAAKPVAEKVPTHEAAVAGPAPLLARHGVLILKVMKRCMVVTMIAIVAVLEVTADPTWIKVQAYFTRVPEPVVALEDAPRAPKRSPAPEASARPIAREIAPRPVPQESPSRAPAVKTQPAKLPTPASAPAPRPAKPRPPSAASSPAKSPSSAVKSLPTEQDINRHAQRQVDTRVHELCTLDKAASQESGEVCLDLVIDKQGIPTGESSGFSVSPDGAFLNEVGKKCVVRVAKAHIKLNKISPLPRSIRPCFKVRRPS